MFQIGQYEGDYSTYRNLIALTMRIAVYSSYGFVGFFVIVAFACSGKNRDCLEKKKCCRRHIMMFVVIIMIILAILYLLTLICTSVIGIPLAFATMMTTSCNMVYDVTAATINSTYGQSACLNLEFLGVPAAQADTLCKGNPEFKEFCTSIDEAVTDAYFCWAALLIANIALVLGLVAFGANFAYIKSIKDEIKKDPETIPMLNANKDSKSKISKEQSKDAGSNKSPPKDSASKRTPPKENPAPIGSWSMFRCYIWIWKLNPKLGMQLFSRNTLRPGIRKSFALAIFNNALICFHGNF